MAEFVTVMEERKRMCKTLVCDKCPLRNHNTSSVSSCVGWMCSHPAEAERIIMEWAADHPLITNGMKFREVFGEDMMAMLTGEHAPLGDWLDAEYKGGHDSDIQRDT